MSRGRHRRGEVREADGPVALGEGIRRAIASLGIETQILEQRVLLLWPGVVGERVARTTRVDAIRRGELFVSVRQDAWRHRLFFERESIRERLNREVGREVVRSIHFGK